MAKRRYRRRRRGGRRGRPSALSRLTVVELMGELDRRRGMISDLVGQRDQLQGDLERVNAEISDLESIGVGAGSGAMAAGRRGRRGRRAGAGNGRRRGGGAREGSLISSLHRVLQGRTLGISEMADAVQKAGYKTSSPNFRTIVNATLLSKNGKKMFRKVARGQYTSK